LPVPFKVKASRVGNSVRITIPKEVLEYLKIKEGDILILSVTDKEFTVKKEK